MSICLCTVLQGNVWIQLSYCWNKLEAVELKPSEECIFCHGDLILFSSSLEWKPFLVLTAFLTIQRGKFTSDLSSVSPCPADAQVQDFLLHSQSDMGNTSQGMWLQQTCTLFIQSGVQLLTEFTQHAAAWSNTSVVRANFSQPNHTRSQLARAGHNHGKQEGFIKCLKPH